MGAIRFGPADLPAASSFDAAVAELSTAGYRACEFGFVGGFWLDYETAPLLGAAAAAADVALSVHAPLAAFMGHWRLRTDYLRGFVLHFGGQGHRALLGKL